MPKYITKKGSRTACKTSRKKRLIRKKKNRVNTTVVIGGATIPDGVAFTNILERLTNVDWEL